MPPELTAEAGGVSRPHRCASASSRQQETPLERSPLHRADSGSRVRRFPWSFLRWRCAPSEDATHGILFRCGLATAVRSEASMRGAVFLGVIFVVAAACSGETRTGSGDAS